jgi:hypothetical protein
MFMTICVGTSYSLPMTPSQYIEEDEKNPRLMAIFRAIQASVRKWSMPKRAKEAP